MRRNPFKQLFWMMLLLLISTQETAIFIRKLQGYQWPETQLKDSTVSKMIEALIWLAVSKPLTDK